MEALPRQQSGGDQTVNRRTLHADPFFRPSRCGFRPVAVPASRHQEERIPGTHGLPPSGLRFPLAAAGGNQDQREVRQLPAPPPAEVEVLRVARLRVALSGMVGEGADGSQTTQPARRAVASSGG